MYDYRPLAPRLNFALIATTALIALLAANFLAMLRELFVYEQLLDGGVGYQAYISANNLANTVSLICLGALVISYISNSMWIFRASWLVRYIHGSEANQSPWLTTLGNAIPIANLWVPFRGLRQILNTSETGAAANLNSGEATGRLKILWAVWVMGTLISNVAGRMFLMDDQYITALRMSLVGDVLAIVASLLFIAFMRQTTKGLENQSHGGLAARVFGDH